MRREWKPGDVAMVDGQVAMIYNDGSLRATFVYTDADDDPCSIYARDADTRPLVMIDPEDREQVERLYASWLDDNLAAPEREAQVNAMQAALREFANPTPPRPDEPTDPTARVTDRRENIWRQLADGDWVCTSGPDVGEYLNWDQLAGDRGPVTIEVDR